MKIVLAFAFATLAVLATPAAALDVSKCAELRAQADTDFKDAVKKAMTAPDKDARCAIGRDAMKILDRMAEVADACPPAVEKPTEPNGEATMKLLRDGETVKQMVDRRKAAFARECGS